MYVEMCTSVVILAVCLASLAGGNGDTNGTSTDCLIDKYLLEGNCVDCPQNSTRPENSTVKLCFCLDGYLTATGDNTTSRDPCFHCRLHSHLTNNSCHCDDGYVAGKNDPTCLPLLKNTHWYDVHIILKKVLIITGAVCALVIAIIIAKYYRSTKKKKISRSPRYSRLSAGHGAGGMEELEDEEDIEMSIYEKK